MFNLIIKKSVLFFNRTSFIHYNQLRVHPDTNCNMCSCSKAKNKWEILNASSDYKFSFVINI